MPRRVLALAAITAGALVLRSLAIDHRFSSDDAYTWYVSTAPSLHVFYERLIHLENTPPLYYALCALFVPPGGSELWVRIPAALASTASVPVLYALARPLLGTRTALLAAGGLAVAPFAISLADQARGFALADLALLVVVWAAARLAQGAPGRRWWPVYAGAALVALYTEYTTPLVVALVAVVLLGLGRPRRRETVAFTALPALLYLPWLPAFAHALSEVDVSKVAGVPADPSLHGARNLVLGLVFGRTTYEDFGALGGPRAVLAAVAVIVAAAVLWRRSPGPERVAFWLTAGVGGAVFALHWVLGALGVPGTFGSRYVGILVPLAVVVAAAALAAVPWRPLLPLAGAALVVLAVPVGVLRWRSEPYADLAPVLAAARTAHPRTVLTNTAIVAYYLRPLHPRLDFAFGLGTDGEAACAGRCPGPLVIVDDTSTTAGGARPGPGRTQTINGYAVRVRQGA